MTSVIDFPAAAIEANKNPATGTPADAPVDAAVELSRLQGEIERRYKESIAVAKYYRSRCIDRDLSAPGKRDPLIFELRRARAERDCLYNLMLAAGLPVNHIDPRERR
jgi:hypothetical protein